MGVNIPTNFLKRSRFYIKTALTVETKRLPALISTIIRQTAKVIDVPELTVSDANSHSLACKTSVGTATIGNSQITINNKSDNSIDYCEDDFQDDEVGFKNLIREQLTATVMKKINQNFATNVLAAASTVAGTVDLSTDDKVNDFDIDVAMIASNNSFFWKPRVEHGQIIKAKYQGQGFVFADSEVYRAYRKAFDTIKYQSTFSAVNENNNMFVTPHGVVVIDASGLLGDPKQMIYGIAGAPYHAYRSDKIEHYDKEIVSRSTAGSDSGDLVSGDEVIQIDHNMGLGVWENAGVTNSVSALVKKQKMA